MEYVNLGRTGLKVSRICLGCMGFGSDKAEFKPMSVKKRQEKSLNTHWI